MTESTKPAAETDERELVITRTFDAPRELVWRALTESEHLRHWWGPSGFTMQHCILDLRPGGVFHYGMTSPDGHPMWGKFTFREIVRPERIVFTNAFSDEAGNTVRAPFSSEWPLEMLITWTLTEHDGATTLTMRGRALTETAAERAIFEAEFPSMRQGFGDTFDQLADYLTTVRNTDPPAK